jgi:hypothetical protein
MDKISSRTQHTHILALPESIKSITKAGGTDSLDLLVLKVQCATNPHFNSSAFAPISIPSHPPLLGAKIFSNHYHSENGQVLKKLR